MLIGSVGGSLGPNLLITRKDILSTRGQLRYEMLGEPTVIQALLLALDSYNRGDTGDTHLKPPENYSIPQQLDSFPRYGYVYYYHLDPNGHLDYLFFMHPVCLATLKENHDIIAIDCTCKTNRHGMPVAHLTGRTCSNKTFDIAYTFINKERQENYAFIILNFRTIFIVHLPGCKPIIFVTDKEKALKNR